MIVCAEYVEARFTVALPAAGRNILGLLLSRYQHVLVYMRAYACACACACACIHVHIHMHVHIHTLTHTCIFLQMHMHIHTHTLIYIHEAGHGIK